MQMQHAYSTALVTGASSGIGRHLAGQLAADGCDLVILARRTGLLDELAAQLREQHKVSVEVLTADLTSPDGLAAATDRLSDAGRPVELLVNNAGVGSSGSFADLPAASVAAQVSLNVMALVALTHAALPSMLRRGHGGVLNVSSVAGFFAMPGSAVYGATKAFVTSFSESLSGEVADQGVHVTALCPGFTRTASAEDHSGEDHSGDGGMPEFAWLDAGRVARAGLDAVASGRVICVPGAQYKAVVPLAKIVPRRAIRSVMKAMRRP
jgi:short-subunit dehydrogenase